LKKTEPKSEKPALTMRTEIEQLIRKNNLYFCLECGKCSAICPMVDFYGEYDYDRSPRGVVERLSLDPENADDEALWYCLTCQECTFYCPSGVTFQAFMTELRERLLEHGYRKYASFCPVCGNYLMPKKEIEYLKKRPDTGAAGDLLSTCARCKQATYRDTLHRFAHWPKKRPSS